MSCRLPVLLFVLVTLSGCFDHKALLKKLVPLEQDRQAKSFLESVRDGRIQEARQMLHSSIDQADTSKGLETLRALFTQSKWVEAENIGYVKNWSNGMGQQSQTTIRLDYQIQLEKHWLAGTIVLLDEPTSRKIISARFNPITASLETINALTLSGKGPFHYLILPLAALVPIFCLITLVLCIRTRLRRKWLWILFIVLPVGKLSLNWSTGELGYQLLAFQLFGASLMKSGLYAPWLMGVSFPLGAVIFLLNRKSLTLPAPDSSPPPLPQ